MSPKPTDLMQNKEWRVLRAMKQTLTGVIRDTTTRPGLRHPLSDDTIENIRQCLMLITARERELVAEAGAGSTMRPHFTDEPQKRVVVPIRSIKKSKKKPKRH
jgi:hypothetical protein